MFESNEDTRIIMIITNYFAIRVIYNIKICVET